MTEKEMKLICMKQAETNLEMVCYLHTSFESGMYQSGMYHNCDECELKRKNCILYALKNIIYDMEAEP